MAASYVVERAFPLMPLVASPADRRARVAVRVREALAATLLRQTPRILQLAQPKSFQRGGAALWAADASQQVLAGQRKAMPEWADQIDVVVDRADLARCDGEQMPNRDPPVQRDPAFEETHPARTTPSDPPQRAFGRLIAMRFVLTETVKIASSGHSIRRLNMESSSRSPESSPPHIRRLASYQPSGSCRGSHSCA